MLLSDSNKIFPLIFIIIGCGFVVTVLIFPFLADSNEPMASKLQEDYQTGAINMVEFFISVNGSLLKINERLHESEENVKHSRMILNLSLEKINQRIDALVTAGVQRQEETMKKILALQEKINGRTNALETAGVRRNEKIMEKIQDKNKTSPVAANVNAGSIKTKNYNCYLTVKDSAPNCSSTADENWLIEGVDDGFYTLSHLCSEKALGIPSSGTSTHHYEKLHVISRDGAKLNPWYHWKIQHISRSSQKYYKFINRATNLALDYNGDVYHHPVNDGEYQLWTFQKTSSTGSCLTNQ